MSTQQNRYRHPCGYNRRGCYNSIGRPSPFLSRNLQSEYNFEAPSCSFQVRPRTPYAFPHSTRFYTSPFLNPVEGKLENDIKWTSSQRHQDTLRKDLVSDTEDDPWVRNWVSVIADQRSERKKEQAMTNLRISDIQEKVMEYDGILEELQRIHSKLTQKDIGVEEWKSSQQRAEFLKIQLEDVKAFFMDSTNMTKIKDLVILRRRKRLRARKKKAQLTNKLKCKKDGWDEKERLIDAWRNRVVEKEASKLRDRELKKEADGVLSEVRMKQDEAKEIRNLVATLRCLRAVRTKKGEMHGYVTTEENNALFDKMASELEYLIESQMKQYTSEEKTLRVMMEEAPGIPKRHRASFEGAKREINELLFGRKSAFQGWPPELFSFYNAEESVAAVIQRRAEWDQYIATDSTPLELSSAIPFGWVLPPPDPTEEWRVYL